MGAYTNRHGALPKHPVNLVHLSEFFVWGSRHLHLSLHEKGSHLTGLTEFTRFSLGREVEGKNI